VPELSASGDAPLGPRPNHGARRLLARHPNATVALVTGSGFGSLLVWLLELINVNISGEVGAAIGGAIPAVVLFIGRRSVKGAILALWSGDPDSW
jgi:hypothetical protein